MLIPASVQIACLLFVSVFLFLVDRIRVDFVALLILISLLLLDILPNDVVMSGFSNPAVITVACMFVLSAGLQRTGIVNYIGNKLNRLVGKTTHRMSAVLMATCSFFSAFISNTATVAVLMPVAIRLAKEKGVSPSRLLMPLSFAAQFGGVCTLVGTTTNLLVNNIAQEYGLAGFSMFEFAKLGVVCFFAGLLYMLTVGRYLLKDKPATEDVTQEYQLKDYLTEMRVMEGSRLVGQKGGENELTGTSKDDTGIRILDIFRKDKVIWAPQNTAIQEGDVLLIRGDVERVIELSERLKLEDWAKDNLNEVHLKAEDVTLIEVMLPSGSNLIRKSLNQLDFYWRYHAAVLGVRRRGEVIQERISKIDFKEGDTLLLQGHQADLEALAQEDDFVLLQDLSPLKLKTRRAFVSLSIMLFVVVSAALGVLPLLTATLIGAVLMVVGRCISVSEAYGALDFKVLVLLAGLIPLGYAMTQTGAAANTVHWLVTSLGSYGPFAALSVIYIITVVLTSVMSNAATAVLLSPIAIGLAESFNVQAEPFLMAVAFAASTCFSTPVGYQTNVMIMGPGGYSYKDYVKVGVPLNVIFFVISVTLIPLIWHF